MTEAGDSILLDPATTETGTRIGGATTTLEIVALLDRSGSMSQIRDDMVGGFNTFVEEQKLVPGDCWLTLVQFDSEGIETVYESKPIGEVPPLKLVPRGNTPLLDAVGRTINNTVARIAKSTISITRADKTLFLIITDGQENASKEFTKQTVKQLITLQQNLGWQFVYLGANVDAFAEAGGIGIPSVSTASFSGDSAGVRAAYANVSSSVSSLRTGGSYTITDEERLKMDPNWKVNNAAATNTLPTEPLADWQKPGAASTGSST